MGVIHPLARTLFFFVPASDIVRGALCKPLKIQRVNAKKRCKRNLHSQIYISVVLLSSATASLTASAV